MNLLNEVMGYFFAMIHDKSWYDDAKISSKVQGQKLIFRSSWNVAYVILWLTKSKNILKNINIFYQFVLENANWNLVV